MTPSAKIIADSISFGNRLTTMEVTFHRFVLSEFNTHRVFSRNSASSRAIPVERQLADVEKMPAYPLEWRSERPGMQGGDILSGVELDAAEALFSDIHQHTVESIKRYIENTTKESRLHKSLINRLLEPFLWHTVIVTSTEWDSFWEQRCSELAQPEIKIVAFAMKDAYDASEPAELTEEEWHMPYIGEKDIQECEKLNIDPKKVSVGRCARVSYLTHDGIRDLNKDVELYEKLKSAEPPHASPFEHVATPRKRTSGNFTGWEQLRHIKGL